MPTAFTCFQVFTFNWSTPMPAVIPRPRLTLRQPCRESAPVREAKQIARDIGYADDPHMVAFALALIESRDAWENRPQRGRI
jgi:hypothetical protein